METCQNCAIRPAAVFLTRRVNGRDVELRLCNHCASALAGPAGAGPYATAESLLEGIFGPRPQGRRDVLGQLSEQAQLVLQKAARAALDWGLERLLPEHLLLALIDEVPEIRERLEQAGIPAAEYEERLAEVIGRREPRAAAGIALSSGVKKVLEIARLTALQMGHGFIGPEHLLLAIRIEGESFAAQFLGNLDAEKLRKGIEGEHESRQPPPGDRLPPNLTRYGRDLTALAAAGDLDPIIGRDNEIARVIRVLSRKTKNNPVLVGDPGVGKTAIAEGLAQRIASGQVPEVLKDKKVIALDLGGMIAGTKFRGEFEERLTGVMKEIRALKGKIVLFIDELHTLLGAGAAEGAMDAASLLKPALARGELQCLGATTLDEYRKQIEKDAALERRFQPVLVSEPTPEQAVEILRGLRDSYEAHHRVKILDEALTAAVELSDRYVSDRFLPDKAIDLLDEAAAMVRLANKIEPARLKQLEERLAEIDREKRAAASQERYDQAAKLKSECEAAKAELEGLKRQWQERRGTEEPVVDADAIATIVSEWTGIPAKRLRSEEAQRLLEMERALESRVIGQEEAIRAVSEAVRRARAGLKDPDRPIGSFIFLGPTGVGKTETARALAEYLFNDEDALLRFDMSEFQERHTVSRLVGAPPGYVGYEEAGKLTEAVRRKPYSVVLFDEIEKAHPDVFNLLLQVLDDGRLTDAKGRTVSFKNTVVIMTSNLGTQDLAWRTSLGFRGEAGGRGDEAALERARDRVLAALREQFRPEFLNRVDEIIVFHPLTREQLGRIIDLMLEATRRKLEAQHLGLALTPAAKDALAERGFDPKWGARPLRRAIQRELETEISRRLLRGEIPPGSTVAVDFRDGRFTFEAAAPAPAEAPASPPS